MAAARVNLYLDRGSLLYRMHPQVKLGLLAATFLSAYLVDDARAVLPVAVAIAALLWLAGAAANVRRLRALFLAVPVVTFLVWSVFYGRGEPVPGLGRIGVTSEGMRYAAGMALKLETFLASSILFLSITRVEEFTAALRGLGLPGRVSFAIALSFRLVPLFLASALVVVDAQKARGLEFSRGTLTERLRRYVPIVVPVFMAALRRADSMAMALEVRGFSSDRPRTIYARARFGAIDWLAASALLATAAVY
ncbi:MAG: energy-coupling factor transporter transmembrane component T family protein, partial [Candidatus Binatia bacterium]